MTKIIGFVGGPGTGKTTRAHHLTAEMSMAGILVEYVPEYAKELVWEEQWKKIKDQRLLMGEMSWRFKRLDGKVDFIVTDCPLVQNMTYASPEYGQDFFNDVYQAHLRYDHDLFFLKRSVNYQREGRIEDMNQAIGADIRTKQFLEQYSIPYTEIGIEEAVPFIMKKYIGENK